MAYLWAEVRCLRNTSLDSISFGKQTLVEAVCLSAILCLTWKCKLAVRPLDTKVKLLPHLSIRQQMVASDVEWGAMQQSFCLLCLLLAGVLSSTCWKASSRTVVPHMVVVCGKGRPENMKQQACSAAAAGLYFEVPTVVLNYRLTWGNAAGLLLNVAVYKLYSTIYF